MKTLKISFLSVFFIVIAHTGFSQAVKKETFKVAGECGMCKKKIETAAKNAGASYAVWNVASKELKVKYKSTSANAAKIQQSIANVGYDTPYFKATEEAYNNLHECCRYDRAAVDCCANMNCCDGGTCKADHSCCADCQCSKDIACCNEDSDNADCCTKS